MVSAALNAPELRENLKLSHASALLPPPPPLLLALVGPQAGVEALAGHFRSMLVCMLKDKTVLIMVFGEICQNKHITEV